ncbi:hypothetical protein EXE43_04140 [Halorubrum sp. SS5]|uniref:Uncharacterized protein n=1 Tax=Halorubrum salinarum TaxID=2739057 RepID=A0A7D3Y0B5_9EURY|nr:hypothetical protein [Halorubrum salinarum]QKG92692.1 hypothetical protein HPS36_07460 [Halorubrum salinarum]TKX87265.1 hypothetical protein EXE43_04140 [Halorubrum sp. SS5]
MSLQLTPAVAVGVLCFLLVWVAIGAWVNFDSHARGSDHPGFWGVLAPVSGIVLLYYMLWWRRGRSRRYPASRWEEATAIVAVAGPAGLVVGSLVSPPDPISQLTVWPVAFAGCLPVAYLMVRRRFDTTGGSPVNNRL